MQRIRWLSNRSNTFFSKHKGSQVRYRLSGKRFYCAAVVAELQQPSHTRRLYMYELKQALLARGRGEGFPRPASPTCCFPRLRCCDKQRLRAASWLEAAELHSVVASVTRGQHHHTTTMRGSIKLWSTMDLLMITHTEFWSTKSK